jgi:hypothetical protein
MQQNNNSAAAQETPEISAARLAANRANAQHSSGPTSASGKAKASLNALKTGLTGVTIMLPSEDANAYKAHILSYEKQFKPVGPEECALVQSIADIRWRLNRIPALEMALITIGRSELAAKDESYNRAELDPVLEMEIRRAYEKDFRNLHLQENRLARRREKEMTELRALQAERKAQEAEDLQQLAKHYMYAQSAKKPFDPAALGFEFSKERFITFLARQYPGVKYEDLPAQPAATKQATV